MYIQLGKRINKVSWYVASVGVSGLLGCGGVGRQAFITKYPWYAIEHYDDTVVTSISAFLDDCNVSIRTKYCLQFAMKTYRAYVF